MTIESTCTHDRLDVFEVSHNEGLAKTKACLDCGHRDVTWLREQAPHVVRTPVLMRAAGDTIPGAQVERQLWHLEHQRAVVQAREAANLNQWIYDSRTEGWR